ncbi:hypothetical protein [Actinoplanes sp. M2I2]|uniref:hypothetical protein n=1 Tax=Actinoplanes sp. M2I2 TaxID=1734444 RepID=UPI00201FD965|nr:hypothetical protein [Actinoplanes sp. M2I2]
MTPFKRWRIAIPLVIISAIALGATVLGAWAYWEKDTTAQHLLTVFLGIIFALCVGISISIGADRKIEDTPWLRIGTVALFILLACGVSWVRDVV